MRITVAVLLILLCVPFLFGRLGMSATPEETIYTSEIELIRFVELVYPAMPRVARIQGLVVVRAQMDDGGNVVDAAVLSGPKPLITDSLANIKKWKFKPNKHKAVIVVYDFRLDDGTCHDDKRSHFSVRGENLASIVACVPTIGK